MVMSGGGGGGLIGHVQENFSKGFPSTPLPLLKCSHSLLCKVQVWTGFIPNL